MVHTEDSKRVHDLIERMYHDHVLPEAEFRIVRPDGKIRFFKQSGKLHTNTVQNRRMADGTGTW